MLKAAAELGYRANGLARRLVSGRTHTSGVVVTDLLNPFYAEVLHGINTEARAAAARRGLNRAGRALSGPGMRRALVSTMPATMRPACPGRVRGVSRARHSYRLLVRLRAPGAPGPAHGQPQGEQGAAAGMVGGLDAAAVQLSFDSTADKTNGWVDFHNLQRINGVWKITNKTATHSSR